MHVMCVKTGSDIAGLDAYGQVCNDMKEFFKRTLEEGKANERF